MKYNKNFEFNVEDIDAIEVALRKKVSELSKLLHDGAGDADSLRTEIKATSALLARIHHQKTWYRPKTDIYVSG